MLYNVRWIMAIFSINTMNEMMNINSSKLLKFTNKTHNPNSILSSILMVKL